MDIFEDLVWRGLIKDSTVDSEKLKDLLNGKSFSFYWGTDPTADSLHLGHYSSLCMAKRLAMAGHHPILLCGGATGRIGDPRPTAEREIISEETVNKNIEGIRNQLKTLVPEAELVDNYQWTKDYTLDIIQRRLDTGITFAEFAYMLLQGKDFLHLFTEKNCIMQVAGSDQWGNITTGVDLIRKIINKEAYAFTMPLILDSTGKKFGKSEGNALWLDLNKTSSYEIYQYLMNTEDSKVLEYFKVFTFIPKEQIEKICTQHFEHPELRNAQRTLAWEVVKDIHGVDEANKAEMISSKLFNNNYEGLSATDILSGFKGVPSFNITENFNLVDLLVNNKIASSKREAREFINGKAISINGKVITDLNTVVDKSFCLDGGLVIIRKGKKKFFIGKF